MFLASMPRKLVEAIMHNWNFDAGSIATETAATMTLSGRLTIPHTEAPPSFLFVVYLRPRGAGVYRDREGKGLHAKTPGRRP